MRPPSEGQARMRDVGRVTGSCAHDAARPAGAGRPLSRRGRVAEGRSASSAATAASKSWRIS